MKRSDLFKVIGFVMALFWGSGMACAQSTSILLQQKQELEQTSGTNYDIWKASVIANNELEPNKVLTSTTTNGLTTHLIRLGYNLANQDAEDNLESKLEAQPGIISLDVDHTTNSVEITLKEEDEHDALKSYFDIE